MTRHPRNGPYRILFCTCVVLLASTSVRVHNAAIDWMIDDDESLNRITEVAHKSPKYLQTTNQFYLENAENVALEYLQSQLPQEYHSRILASARAAVQPLWRCHDEHYGIHMQSNQTASSPSRSADKFMFVHVFKTAGSTMRQFFHEYSTRCPSKSYATLTSCTGVSSKRLATPIWHPCILKDGRERGRFQSFQRHPVPKEDLQNFDVIGGHFRLGLMDHLHELSAETSNNSVATTPDVFPRLRNLVFVRNAALKYISGKVYIKAQQVKNLTAEYIISDMSNEIQPRNKHHVKYANYLLTPTQERERGRQKWDYAQTTQLMMQNLVDYNVTIGVTDDMDASMRLLAWVLDSQNEVPALFSDYGGGSGNQTIEKKRNISPLSSETILESIRKDHPSTYSDLMEFVKYEDQVTKFAMSLQKLQLQAMIELQLQSHR